MKGMKNMKAGKTFKHCLKKTFMPSMLFMVKSPR